MKPEKKVRVYCSFDTDFCETKNQNFRIPAGYRWIREGAADKILSAVLYSLAIFFSFFYLKFFLHVKIKGKEKIRQAKKSGFFLYANHTQPIGDVFLPAFACFPKRIYTVVSPANLGIPVIGKLLPALGALPLADTVEGMAKLSSAIKRRAKEGNCVVIYPEGHVWEYFTDIRPFTDSSFSYPARLDLPVYCMTVTYRKRKFGKRPRALAIVDGPFFDGEKSVSARKQNLYASVYKCMTERAKGSDCEYILYEKSNDPCGD